MKRKNPAVSMHPDTNTLDDRGQPSTFTSNGECGYQIVTLAEWITSHKPRQPLPLVDLRPNSSFDIQHLSYNANSSWDKNAPDTKVTIVNLPLSTLISGERSCELPPRHVEFAILIPHHDIPSFTNNVTSCKIHSLFFATKSKSTSQSRKPWLVRQVLLEDDDFWEEAGRLGLLTVKVDDGDDVTNDTTFQRLPRLWKPDPMIQSDVLRLLKDGLQNNTTTCGSKGNNKQTSGVVLDLGSGAGRDICFLAEELKDYYYSSSNPRDHDSSLQFPLQFIGIDNHKGSAKRCMPLWDHRGVSDVTQAVNMNLDKLNEVHDFLETSIISSQTNEETNQPILCICAIRYLNRKLFAHLAMSTSAYSHETSIDSNNTNNQQQKSRLTLPKGTIIAISHFCKAHPSSQWNFDHPKESHVLDRWELRDLFNPDAGDNSNTNETCWKVIRDDICSDGDHGRTLIQFVVVKTI
eukprot:scaffold5481_cov47-Cyclotella_meneghiniana.AAC.1